MWLQGGPGCSSSIGNFYELGPWHVNEEDLCLHPNPYPWNHHFGLLFLDNPVGVGFSIAPSLEDIPSDQDHVARDVYVALEGFYERFPEFQSRPFYVTGESYAGKYVPSIATHILRKQEEKKKMVHLHTYGGHISHHKHIGSSSNPSLPLRLDGIAIGNGLTHPIVQVYIIPSHYCFLWHTYCIG